MKDMNETLSTIAKRFSCRGFDGKPVSREQQEAIALAALQAPSGMNLQPWQLVVINDKSLIEEMDCEGMRIISTWEDNSVYERFMARGGTLFYDAPCMFVIQMRHGKELDCGIMAQNIALAASSLGLGNVICGMARIPLSGSRGSEFMEKIGFQEGWEFGMSVLVGHGTVANAPHKPDMSKLSFVD